MTTSKKDQSVRDESARWNTSRSSLCDDWYFICELICQYLAKELQWPDEARKNELKRREPMFYGCLGFIDGTLVKIQRPYDLEESFERRFYTGRKKIYAFNNTMVIDHDGLIIYLDPGYPGSFHDITILRQSHLFHNWRQYFNNNDVSFEYLMGDRELIVTVRQRNQDFSDAENSWLFRM